MPPDQILYWNEVALEANRVSHSNDKKEQTGPPLSSRALAIVHLAMYDAYGGATQNAALPHYLTPPPCARVSADAAVAAAAHTALSVLFPSQRPFFDRKLTQAPLQGPALDDGYTFGRTAALSLLYHRRNDPGAGDAGYMPSLARGHHRPDPDNPDQGFHAPFYGAGSRPFAVTGAPTLLPPPWPTTPANPQYQSSLQQVRGKGIAPELMGALPAGLAARTPEETVIGLYWGYDGAAELGTPPRLYNQIIRTVAIAQGNTPADNARLFALVNAAMADAGIFAWKEKYTHDLWRPVVGIREHDLSMGPAGEGAPAFSPDSDPEWLPLGAPSTNAEGKTQAFTPAVPIYPSVHLLTGTAKNFTPNFPAYPSGHATFGAAAFYITRLFYGVQGTGADNLFDGLSFVSDELNGVNKDNRGTVRPRHVRSFPDGLWQMIKENGRSRVYLGVHWLFDAFLEDENGEPDLGQNVGGVPLGIAIANDIWAAGGGTPATGPR